jgi:BlaI family penicillinase repressor
MKIKPRISNAELQVMRVIWEKAPVTVNDVVGTLSKSTSWKRETIRTLINRLEKKKAVRYEKKGRSYQYHPLVSQEEYAKADAASILERAGAAIVKPILAAFVEKEQLSEEEIQELKSILDKKAEKK